MTIRLRIFLAIATVSLLTIGLSAFIHYQNLSAEYEKRLTHQAAAIADSLRTELDQTKASLDSLMEQLIDEEGVLTRDFPMTRPANRYQWAAQFSQGQFLDVLKVLDNQGQILTSAHWPASFGAIDPLFERYTQTPIDQSSPFSIAAEATASGTTPSLQVWREAKDSTGSKIVLAVGRFIHQDVLEVLLARSGGDLIAICNSEGLSCLSKTSEKVPKRSIQSIKDFYKLSNLYIHTFGIGPAGGIKTIRVGIGVSHNLDSLGQDLIRQAISTSIFGLLLALLLGLFLSHRIGFPLSKLVQASGEVAAGDFRTRVEVPPNSAREVNLLVDGFNTMASELEQSRANLLHAERVATWQEIARGLAHEIKNPLTPILAALRVVQRAREKDVPNFDAILAEQATAVHEEVSRLKAMADNFAKFARLPEPSSEPIEIHRLLSQIATLYQNTYPDIDFTLSTDNEGRIIDADSDRLRTVFSNLILNAAQAMDGKGSLKISTVSVESNQRLEILVHDSGPGIAPEIEDRLFLPYATTKGSSGTGLGLALAHRIIIEMGGTIELDSTVSQGACFRVII